MRALVMAIAILALVAPVATAADGEPRKSLTKEGQKTARSVVLKRADLGSGFTAKPRGDDDRLPKGARCGALDESDLTVTGDAASPDFRFEQGAVFVTVGSTAQVYRTLREANASWRRGTAAQTTTCLADIVRLSAAPGQKITVLSAKRVPFPSVSPKATAYRLVLQHQRRRRSAGSRVRRRGRPPARAHPVRAPVHVDRAARRRRSTGSRSHRSSPPGWRRQRAPRARWPRPRGFGG